MEHQPYPGAEQDNRTSGAPSPPAAPKKKGLKKTLVFVVEPVISSISAGDPWDLIRLFN